MIVTFCGHKNVSDSTVVGKKLRVVIEELISRGATEFYLGGYGGFDSLAASTVRSLKASHPDIRLILVIPYLNREYDSKAYDELLYPPLENVLPRYAISKRNEWMVEEAQVVVSYVTHDWGGASKTLAFAKRKKKEIISVVPDTP